MSIAVKLPEKLVSQAKIFAGRYHRSVPKQIEYWSYIGKVVEENPDLPYNFIKDIMLSLSEADEREIEPYPSARKTPSFMVEI